MTSIPSADCVHARGNQWHLADAHIIKNEKSGSAGGVAVHAAALQQKQCPVPKRNRAGKFLLAKGAMKQ
jgi:hypothetical protein